MRIIDAHMHLGEDIMFNTDDSEEVLLAAMERNGIAAMLLMPGILPRDHRKAHERISRFARSHPGRAAGIACFNPYIEDGEYASLVRWAAKDLGFRGVKLQPQGHCMPPNHPAADKIYRAAMELDITVMIHTGGGVPASLPALCIPVARKYPKLRIVMAHAGGGMFGSEAVVVAQECPNVYLETSWAPVYELAAMVKQLGPRRVMFGSDIPPNIPVELAKYRSLGLPERDLEWCLARTAEEAFRIAW